MGIISKLVNLKVDGKNTVFKVSTNEFGEALNISSVYLDLPINARKLTRQAFPKQALLAKIEWLKFILPLVSIGVVQIPELADIQRLIEIEQKENSAIDIIQAPHAQFVYHCREKSPGQSVLFLTWLGQILSENPQFLTELIALRAILLERYLKNTSGLSELLYSRNKHYAMIGADFMLFLAEKQALVIRKDSLQQFKNIREWKGCPVSLKEKIIRSFA